MHAEGARTQFSVHNSPNGWSRRPESSCDPRHWPFICFALSSRAILARMKENFKGAAMSSSVSQTQIVTVGTVSCFQPQIRWEKSQSMRNRAVDLFFYWLTDLSRCADSVIVLLSRLKGALRSNKLQIRILRTPLRPHSQSFISELLYEPTFCFNSKCMHAAPYMRFCAFLETYHIILVL